MALPMFSFSGWTSKPTASTAPTMAPTLVPSPVTTTKPVWAPGTGIQTEAQVRARLQEYMAALKAWKETNPVDNPSPGMTSQLPSAGGAGMGLATPGTLAGVRAKPGAAQRAAWAAAVGKPQLLQTTALFG